MPDPFTPDEFGYLALFDPDGNQVEASRDDLLSIESMSFDKELHRRVVGNRSGRYWLISNRPDFCAMLLRVDIFRHYPRTPENDEWSVSYCTNGVADFAHWTLDGALQTFRRHDMNPGSWDGAPIPENVVELARGHVMFRAGRKPGLDPLDLHGVRTRDAAEIRERLTQFLEVSVDSTDLLRQVAGKRVAVFELLLAVAVFCNKHGLDGITGDLLEIIVPEDQHSRFVELAQELGDQFGA